MNSALHSSFADATDYAATRPSRRQMVAWEPILCCSGETISACKAPNHRFSGVWRVLVDGEMYYADEIELDMLWEGSSPDALGLEAVA